METLWYWEKGKILVLVIVLFLALLPLFYCNSYECTIVKIIVHFCVTRVAEVFLEFSPIGGNLVPKASLSQGQPRPPKLSTEKSLGLGYFCALLM